MRVIQFVLEHGSIEHFIPCLPVSSRLVLVGHYQLNNDFFTYFTSASADGTF